MTDIEAALAPGAPAAVRGARLEPHGRRREGGRGDDPLDGADVVVRARLREPAGRGRADGGQRHRGRSRRAGDGPRLTIYVATQMPHGFATGSAGSSASTPRTVRVITPYVGGALRRQGRPVRRSSPRHRRGPRARPAGEVVRDPLGEPRRHDTAAARCSTCELGFARDGQIVGLRCRVLGDGGAYGGFGGMLAMGPTRNMAPGRLPHPADRLRRGGRRSPTPRRSAPSAARAARGGRAPRAARWTSAPTSSASIPVELRRRNFIAARRVPLHDAHRDAVRLRRLRPAARRGARGSPDYEELRAEQAAPPRRAATGCSSASGSPPTSRSPPAGRRASSAPSRCTTDGSATIRVGTSATGQGHATSFSMLVSDRLGIPIERIRFIQADTAQVPRGGGTGRLALAAARRRRGLRGRRRGRSTGRRSSPAELLEADARRHRASPSDGRLGVAGVPARALDWAELAAAAAARRRAARGVGRLRARRGRRSPSARTSRSSRSTSRPARCGRVRHVAVDDGGRIVNPLLVAGQQHGGIAQGMAQALWEEFRLRRGRQPADRRPSRPTASRRPPRSASFETSNTETPTPYNPLGAKGIGESATDRLHAGGAERRRRRRSATSACATSTCRARPSGSGGRSRRRGRRGPLGVARCRRRSSLRCRSGVGRVRPEAADVDI